MGQSFRGRFIEAGYPWNLRLQFDDSFIFPETATFTSHVRSDPDSEEIIVTLSTAAGTIVRVNDTTLDIIIPETDASTWPVGRTVVFDIIRTDGGSNQHLGIRIEVPVRKAITRL